MNLTLHVWRQSAPELDGKFGTYRVHEVSPDMPCLEMLDVLNERLTIDLQDPIAFDSDCREGICGACGLMIDGVAHGPELAIVICQLHRLVDYATGPLGAHG